MPDYFLIFSFLIILVLAFFGGFLARKLKQPVMLGYLFAGLFASFFLQNIGLNNSNLQIASEIGIAFLMFTLGLEFHPEKFKQIKRVIVNGSILQILFSILIFTVCLNVLFKINWQYSFIAGCAFSLSSTAIVSKLLSEKNKQDSLSGEIMIGWLLLQDLAVLPIMAVLPLVFGGLGIVENLFNFFKSIVIISAVFYFLRILVEKINNFVVDLKSRELLLIFSMILVFSLGLMANALGFSFGVGAFLAGLALGKVSSHFAIFSEIRSLRDVFISVFFVSLGMTLNLGFIWPNLIVIILVSILVLFVKIVLINIILLKNKYHAKTSLECAFGISQVGEFSFALAMVALNRKYIETDIYYLIVSVTLLTMVITPWLFKLSDKTYMFLNNYFSKYPKIYNKFFTSCDLLLTLDELPFEDHIVIIGYGRVGKWIGGMLDSIKERYLVIEHNPQITRKLKLEGKNVVFGDPTQVDVLDFAQVDKAKIVVIAIPEPELQKIIISSIRSLNKKTKIICRNHFDEEDIDLKKLGVDYIIQPEFEASLSMSHRLMQIIGFNKEKINEKVKEMKKEHDLVSLRGMK